MTHAAQAPAWRDELVVEAPDDVEAATEYALRRGWSDGLPIVPPTLARVERMLAYWDRPWDQPVGAFAPRDADILPVQVAANAVMAGCEPRHFPLVMLAIEAMCQPEFNLRGVQSTTHPVAPLVIFNGPVAREVSINGGYNAFGPGRRANAAIGRALRLAMVNIGGAVAGDGDMATMGSPAKYGFVVAENEADSPWEPLHVERGFAADVSTVTVVGGEGPLNINDHFSKDADGLLQMIAGTLANTGANNWYYASNAVLVLGPEHAGMLAAGALSKRDVKDRLFEQATIALGELSSENIEARFRKRDPQRYAQAPPETRLTLVQRADDLVVIVLGGPGKHSMYVPSFGATRAVTRALVLGNGNAAHSIEEFRQASTRPGAPD